MASTDMGQLTQATILTGCHAYEGLQQLALDLPHQMLLLALLMATNDAMLLLRLTFHVLILGKKLMLKSVTARGGNPTWPPQNPLNEAYELYAMRPFIQGAILLNAKFVSEGHAHVPAGACFYLLPLIGCLTQRVAKHATLTRLISVDQYVSARGQHHSSAFCTSVNIDPLPWGQHHSSALYNQQ